MYLYDEYVNHEHHKDLLLSAEQNRLARQAVPSVTLTQRVGQNLLKLGVRLTAQNVAECYTVETSRQVVTVSSA